MSGAPRVSVLMTAYNAACYVRAAVDSVLRQSFTDLELIVIDDGSTDGTDRVLAGFDDPRLRVFRQPNAGVVAARNAGLRHISGEFLAPHDADDLMAPERLARQVAFLDTHPSVVACGTDYQEFGGRDGVVRMPRSPAACRARLLFGTCLSHGTALIRTSALRASGIRYRQDRLYAEDYQFVSEIAEHGDLDNVPYVGLRYRIHAGQISTAKVAAQREATLRIALQHLAAHGVTDLRAADLAPLIWLDETGFRAAVQYLVTRAPRLVRIAGRAAGRAGVTTALRLVRERLNSALRTHPPSPPWRGRTDVGRPTTGQPPRRTRAG